jgi:hypothetical protein
MRDYCVFDIEAENWVNFLFSYFFDGENFYYFDSILEMVDFILKSKYKFFYSHYGGKYDFIFLIDFFVKNNFEFKFVEVDGYIYEIELLNKKLRDSYLILKNSIEKLAIDFLNNEVQKIQVDFENIDVEKLKLRCQNDCKILYFSLQKFFEKMKNEFNLKTKKLTIAQYSLNIFLKLNNMKNIIQRQEINDFCRKGIYGGRCDVFKRYGKNIYYYDFNSFYPSVMLKNDFSIGKGQIIKVKNLKFNENFSFCFTKIRRNETKIGLIPYRLKNGKIIFGYGFWKGYYSSIYNYENNFYNIEEAVIFEKRSRVFKNFVEELAKRKENSQNLSEKLIYKLLMNSLYGKFYQREEKKKYIFTTDNKEIMKLMEKYIVIPSALFQNCFEIILNENDFINRNVIWSVEVLAYSHLEMYKLIKKLIENGFEIFYVDTDSIFTNASPEQIEKLKYEIDDKKIGALKLEGFFDEGIFLFPKFYCLKNKDFEIVKMKGILRELENNFHFQHFYSYLFENKKDVFNIEYQKIGGLKENIRQKRDILSLKTFIKTYNKAVFDKRKLLSDGINTECLYICEL